MSEAALHADPNVMIAAFAVPSSISVHAPSLRQVKRWNIALA
jgi:hypothetical protein